MSTTEEKHELVFRCHTWNGEMTLRVGDEVGVIPGGYGSNVPIICRVVKVSHGGRRVTLDDGRQFTERNRPVGSSGYGHARLTSADSARKLADPKQSLSAFVHEMDELRERAQKAIKARSSSEQFIPLTDDERRELLAIIDRM